MQWWHLVSLPTSAVFLDWWGPAITTSSLLMGGLLAVVSRLMLLDPDVDSISAALRGAPSTALRVTVVVVNVAGCLRLQAGLSLMALLLLGVTSPPARSWLAGRRGSSRRITPGASGGAVPVMTDTDLCAEWRRTHAALLRLARDDARGRELVVTRRREVLDELVRRHPLQMASWLESDPHPAVGPDGFLDPDPPEQAAPTG